MIPFSRVVKESLKFAVLMFIIETVLLLLFGWDLKLTALCIGVFIGAAGMRSYANQEIARRDECRQLANPPKVEVRRPR